MQIIIKKVLYRNWNKKNIINVSLENWKSKKNSTKKIFIYPKKIPNYTLKFKALKEAFKIFDKNRNGYIEAKELKAVTTTLGQALSDDEFSEFWQEADANADGKLDYEEFIKMMLQYWCFWFLYQKIIKKNQF